MTFANTPKTKNKTVVFFPAVLGGSLDNALRKEGLTGWEIMKPIAASKKYNVEPPRDKDGKLSVKFYPDMPNTTSQIRALVSNFQADAILEKIYALHEDPEAMAYCNRQSELLTIALKEDGMV